MTEANDGPSLQQYTETRFNLLLVQVEKLEQTLERRFVAGETARQLLLDGINVRFHHFEEMNVMSVENAKRAVDKAEAQQANINIASNEWRSTLNDFKLTTVSRAEFIQLREDFSAYRLEAARLFSAAQSEKTTTREVHMDSRAGMQDNRAGVSLSMAAIAGIIGILGFILSMFTLFGQHVK